MADSEKIAKGEELIQALELAEQFPARHKDDIHAQFPKIDTQAQHVKNAELKTVPTIPAENRLRPVGRVAMKG